MYVSRAVRTAYTITEKFNPFMTKGGYQASMSARQMNSTTAQQQIQPKSSPSVSAAAYEKELAYKAVAKKL